MRVTFEVAFQALPPSLRRHCTDEAQNAETVLSAVLYIYIYVYYDKTRRVFENNNKQTNKQQHILLKIRNISNYITIPPQIAYKLIQAGRTKGILKA